MQQYSGQRFILASVSTRYSKVTQNDTRAAVGTSAAGPIEMMPYLRLPAIPSGESQSIWWPKPFVMAAVIIAPCVKARAYETLASGGHGINANRVEMRTSAKTMSQSSRKIRRAVRHFTHSRAQSTSADTVRSDHIVLRIRGPWESSFVVTMPDGI